jgi:dGTPase
MADDLITSTAANIDRLGIDSPEAARRAKDGAVAFSAGLAPEVAELQDFLLKHVYLRPAAVEKEADARKIIRELFEAYVADPQRLPERYRNRAADDGLHGTVCDYVAGMTDRFCRNEHARLVPRPPSNHAPRGGFPNPPREKRPPRRAAK